MFLFEIIGNSSELFCKGNHTLEALEFQNTFAPPASVQQIC